MKNLISKIEANKCYYVTYANQCIYELSNKYKTERHPDGRSLKIYGIDYSALSKICKKFGCSGMMVGDDAYVVTNFGYYK